MIKERCENAFYLTLMPDSEENAAEFFDDFLQTADVKTQIPDWDTSYYGFLTWESVKRFCDNKNLEDALAIFNHNGDQIFKERG